MDEHQMEGPEAEPRRSEPLPSLPRRVLMVVTTPATLFERLREQPVALGPLVLGAVLVGIAGALIPIELMQESLRSQMLEAGAEVGEGVGTMARVTWVMGIFGPLLFWPLMAAITAAVYSFVFLVAFGWEGRFRQIFSITAHALLVAAIGMLLVTPLRLLAEDLQLSLSVGSFFFFLPDGLLLRFFELLDLFNLWCYALIGVGAAVIDGERSPGRGIAISLGAALLVTFVIAAIMGAVGGGFAS